MQTSQRDDQPLLDRLVHDARSAGVEEDANAVGRPLFALIAGSKLSWLVAPPGSELPGGEERPSPWRWRAQSYRAPGELEIELATILALLPATEERARDLHRRAIGLLTEQLAAGDTDLEHPLGCLKREIENARTPAEPGEARP